FHARPLEVLNGLSAFGNLRGSRIAKDCQTTVLAEVVQEAIGDEMAGDRIEDLIRTKLNRLADAVLDEDERLATDDVVTRLQIVDLSTCGRQRNTIEVIASSDRNRERFDRTISVNQLGLRAHRPYLARQWLI